MIADNPQEWRQSPEWLAFNINEMVRVKLLPKALAEYRREREELNRQYPNLNAPLEPTLDAEGYYETQLWSLMKDFGHLLQMGFDPAFETTILLRGKALTLPSR